MTTLRGLLLLPAMLSALLMMVGPAEAQGMNARNLVKLARSAADSKDWAKARDYANKALLDEGGYLDAIYMRAFANRMLGDKKKAEEDFREVIKRDPSFLPTYGALADMYLADKEWDKAEKVFNDLGAQNDGAKWASYYRGVMAYNRGDLKKAEAQWTDATTKDVNFAPAIHNKGALALAKKDYTRALAYFTDASEKNPESAMYRFHQAWALAKTGQIPKAQDLLKRIMNESADDQKYWLLARALDRLTRDQHDQALTVLETVTKDYPEVLDGWLLMGRALIATKKPDAAREALTRAKELDEQFVEVSELLSKLPPPKVETPPSGPGTAPGTEPGTEPANGVPTNAPTNVPAEATPDPAASPAPVAPKPPVREKAKP